MQPRVTRLADGRLQASKLHDLRDDLRALGLTVPSDEERHTLSAWRDAVYDQAGESLIEPMLGAGDKRRSLLQRWFRSHELAMPKAKCKLALETAMRAHVNAGQVSGSAAVRTANAGRSAGDELLRRCALRLHCDTNDKYHTHIMEVRSPGMGDARLTLDVRASDMALARSLAERLPNRVAFAECKARLPEARIVTPYTLSKLPRRKGELSIGDCVFTTSTAYDTPHFVGPPVRKESQEASANSMP